MPSLPSLLQWFHEQQTLLHHLLTLPLLLFLFLTFIFFSLNKPQSFKSKSSLPPSPPKLPIIGNLHQLGHLPHRSLTALSQKYGPLMFLQLGRTPTIVISSAGMAKEIMKTHDVIFSDRPVTTASKAFLLHGKDVGCSPYGEYWRQVRKICVIDLLSVKRVRSYKFIREEEITNMVEKLRESCKVGKPVNLSEMIVTLTNNIISRIVLGRRLEGEVEENSELVLLTKEVMDLFGGFTVEDMFPSLRWIDVMTGLDGRMKRASKRLHAFLDEVIDEHRMRKQDDEDKKDFVDILLDCQKDVSLGIPLSNWDVKGILQDLFVAGTDTTYTTIEWAMAELIKHPKVMTKVQEEVRRVVGNKSTVDKDDINEMQYLNYVIKETLRLHPPLAMSLPRLTNAPANIGPYSIPAKIRVILNLWAISRDPKFWDKPDEFYPDRFIDNPVDFKGTDFEFLPFGGGRRVCPGISFGIASIESVLSNLLCWFDWKFPVEANMQDLETEAFGLSVHLKHPVCLVPLSHSR